MTVSSLLTAGLTLAGGYLLGKSVTKSYDKALSKLTTTSSTTTADSASTKTTAPIVYNYYNTKTDDTATTKDDKPAIPEVTTPEKIDTEPTEPTEPPAAPLEIDDTAARLRAKRTKVGTGTQALVLTKPKRNQTSDTETAYGSTTTVSRPTLLGG